MSNSYHSYNSVVDYNDKDKYDVVLMIEAPILTNVLTGLAIYRKHHKATPKTIAVHKLGRLTIGLGETKIKRHTWPLRDALYFSMYQPIKVDAKKREPNKFQGIRTAPQTHKPIYKSRRYHGQAVSS